MFWSQVMLYFESWLEGSKGAPKGKAPCVAWVSLVVRFDMKASRRSEVPVEM